MRQYMRWWSSFPTPEIKPYRGPLHWKPPPPPKPVETVGESSGPLHWTPPSLALIAFSLETQPVAFGFSTLLISSFLEEIGVLRRAQRAALHG